MDLKSNPGPIHFNFPFIKPLEPNTFSDKIELKPSDFIKKNNIKCNSKNYKAEIQKLLLLLNKSTKPIIHIGWAEFSSKFYDTLVRFSDKNNIPILVDGTSELKIYKNSNKTIITNQSAFLSLLNNHPDLIIQFGNAPTSQSVLKYFENTKAKRILINKFGDIKDPSKNKGELVQVEPRHLIRELSKNNNTKIEWRNWFEYIDQKDRICEENKSIIGDSSFGTEPKVIHEILMMIPSDSNIFISNSLPIRDFDYFAPKMKKGFKIFTNRGASGIDGIISTASGIASNSKLHTYLLVGDLAFFP